MCSSSALNSFFSYFTSLKYWCDFQKHILIQKIWRRSKEQDRGWGYPQIQGAMLCLFFIYDVLGLWESWPPFKTRLRGLMRETNPVFCNFYLPSWWKLVSKCKENIKLTQFFKIYLICMLWFWCSWFWGNKQSLRAYLLPFYAIFVCFWCSEGFILLAMKKKGKCSDWSKISFCIDL